MRGVLRGGKSKKEGDELLLERTAETLHTSSKEKKEALSEIGSMRCTILQWRKSVGIWN